MPKEEELPEEEPLCPECKEEQMELIDFDAERKPYLHCNWCGYEQPV